MYAYKANNSDKAQFCTVNNTIITKTTHYNVLELTLKQAQRVISITILCGTGT